MKGFARKRLHAFNASKLGGGEQSVSQYHKARLHGIASIGVHSPATGSFVPLGLLDRCVKQTPIIELKFLGHALAVLHDLEARCKFHRRDIPHLL